MTLASTKSNLRIVNLIPYAGAPIDVTLDDNAFASGLVFESLSLYQQINAGTHTIKAIVTGSVSNLILSNVVALGEANYTYIMFGPITTPIGQLYDDTVVDSGARKLQSAGDQRRGRDRRRRRLSHRTRRGPQPGVAERCRSRLRRE